MTLDLTRPLVYLITKGECEGANFAQTSLQILNIISAAVEANVDLIQIREKNLTGKLLFELTERSAEITHGSATRLLVNDRPDIALAAGADGVNLASDSIPANVVRAHVPEGFVIGVSCHSLDDVRGAVNDGADFALFGPVFASPGKGDGVGLDALAHVCAAAEPFPVVAIGGMDVTNCISAIEAGAAGMAAIRALNDTASLRRVMKELGR